MDRPLIVGIVGEYDEQFVPHVATNHALAHAARRLRLAIEPRWLSTAELEDDLTPALCADALWCAPGSPYASMDGALRALRFGRESGVPTLGTCGGCHHMIIEFARSVLGIEDAQHEENDPYASTLVITQLECSLAGKTMWVRLEPGSRVFDLYSGAGRVSEEYYCNFALNPDYQIPLDEAGFRVTGFDDDGEARVLEVPEHPFYIGTIFVPQTRSRPLGPHPIILGLLRAAKVRAEATKAAV
jgi:CTP synthase (UTP-ammonia lyase)